MSLLINTPVTGTTAAKDPVATLILAHGAGAPMDHEWLELMTAALVDEHIQVVRFNFPYMQKRQQDGKKRPPDRQPKLLAHFAEVIDSVHKELLQETVAAPVYIAGKSMGGRMATLLPEAYPDTAAELAGIIALGFPLHPPGKADNGRGAHLAKLQLPTLIIQGERDSFGSQQEIAGLRVSDQVQRQFLPDGDHSFKPRKASGYTLEQHIETAAQQVRRFIDGQSS